MLENNRTVLIILVGIIFMLIIALVECHRELNQSNKIVASMFKVCVKNKTSVPLTADEFRRWNR